MTRLYAATGDGFARVEGADGEWTATGGLEGLDARAVAVDPADADTVYAGCPGAGLHRSRDGGTSWERRELPEDDVLSVAVSAADGAVYAGTEPSRLFVSRDGGERFEELEALQDIPSRPTWSFPPRPWTSHVRWVAPDPFAAERVLVGIELGGLMYTDDGGASFSDHRPGAQPDVHCIAWHPNAEGRAYEAGGGGAAWSADGGLSWLPADEGRPHRYCWGLAPDPDDADRWFVSAAPGPGQAHGGGPAAAGIYRWDGRGPWRRLAGGLPDPLDAMPYALASSAGAVFAGLADGRIFTSADRGESWTELPVRLRRVVALAVAA